ncbi:MAG: N-acetylmuramoyl-L-alanine amidase [Clostridiales bacterium]|nr:N-acetylmuramoyl-L-alanine amidase [Clostridiales bacterium]
MSTYNVHGGHNSKVPGASKYLDEVTEDRKVKNYVIKYLKAQGHTVYDCTDDAGATQSANLANIVKLCNAHSVDLDISIHLNAGGGTGVEVYYYTGSSAGKTKATAVSAKVAAALGLKNRGAKASSSLYVLKNTKSVAILVECCFVDSSTDKTAWDADACAKAIVEGVTGKAVSGSSDVPYQVKVTISDLNIREGAGIGYAKTGKYTGKGTFTIVEEAQGPIDSKGTVGTWGNLKSGAGWICLSVSGVTKV